MSKNLKSITNKMEATEVAIDYEKAKQVEKQVEKQVKTEVKASYQNVKNLFEEPGGKDLPTSTTKKIPAF
jgi:hypothetical protein